MKNKILISVFLVSICIFYSFRDMLNSNENNAVNSPVLYQQDSFIIGAMHNSRDANYNYLRDTLNFNFWHTYTAPNQESEVFGWPELNSNLPLTNDWLENPVSNYSSDIRERMALNNTKNLRTLIDRPKFQYLAFGQRSDYQCEKADKADPDYWFYTYYNSVDNGNSIKDIQDFTKGSGEYVKQCLYDRTNPGTNAQILFDSLKGNLEQVNNFWQAPWVGDGKYEWYIMPKIRIDSAFANNPLNQEVEVCKIITRNRVGDSLTQILKVKHFKKDSAGSNYHGNYLEIFNNYITDPLTNMVIPIGNWFNNDPQYGINDTHSKVDFKVFWFDKCDMWIDRIRVENQPAHLMMTLNAPYIEEWIRAEVEDIAMAEVGGGNNSPYKFYIEEFEMSHLPCIAYLNKKIISYSNGRFSLMVNYNHDLLKVFIPNSYDTLLSARQIKKYLVDSAALKEVFTECYGLEGWNNSIHGEAENRMFRIHFRYIHFFLL
ncbi:MAG: hypothetical protein IPN57_06195 [Ignavibacteria bacterium]|nr:hypothetical protein [Ignavibacteria bacterium]MBK9404106.1 hypothetical protein [Ignavibacteria bacterium]